jgi:hypothetical protein
VNAVINCKNSHGLVDKEKFRFYISLLEKGFSSDELSDEALAVVEKYINKLWAQELILELAKLMWDRDIKRGDLIKIIDASDVFAKVSCRCVSNLSDAKTLFDDLKKLMENYELEDAELRGLKALREHIEQNPFNVK